MKLPGNSSNCSATSNQNLSRDFLLLGFCPGKNLSSVFSHFPQMEDVVLMNKSTILPQYFTFGNTIMSDSLNSGLVLDIHIATQVISVGIANSLFTGVAPCLILLWAEFTSTHQYRVKTHTLLLNIRIYSSFSAPIGFLPSSDPNWLQNKLSPLNISLSIAVSLFNLHQPSTDNNGGT